MAYTTIAGAMGAILDDERWQGPLTDDERRACLAVVERRFHQAMELTLVQARARLVQIAHMLPLCKTDEQRAQVLKDLLE